MRKILIVVVLFITSLMSLFAGVEHLLPKPQKLISHNPSARFDLSQVALSVPADLTNVFTKWIVEECKGSVSSTSAQTIKVELVPNLIGVEFQEEGYSLDITPTEVLIKATTRQGAVWGLQTIAQLRGNTSEENYLPSIAILDWPAFPIRGYMHDVGRSYIDFELLKKQIPLLARYKVNIFHWHLTEYQGWRLESKLYPEINDIKNYTRHEGGFYTIAQVKELVSLCTEYGMTVIPEIDMPGHSDAFTRAFGFKMQTKEGLVRVKELLAEACETFDGTPWMHIGTDEVSITMPNFVPEVLELLKEKNRKVMSWRPGYGYKSGQADMLQLWVGKTQPHAGIPNIDSRFHYNNHYDCFADIAGMYNSNILSQPKRTDNVVGTIVATWNDRVVRSDKDILIQNQFYASVLAICERAWSGGGDKYVTEAGCMIPPTHTQQFKDFADWERRFLYAKSTHLKEEPIAYVKQTHVKWRITDAFSNGATLDAKFAPEDSLAKVYNVDGKVFNTKVALGSGVYLRHPWGEATVPGFYAAPKPNSTAYAYTWVYSPIEQKVGTWIETQNYGRSEKDVPPRQGKWDYKESRIWINDQEVAPPTWESQHTDKDSEILLTNENFTARPPIETTLNKGWNKILLKLPVGAFSTTEVRLVKWMFAFAFVTMDGQKEIDNIVWSPDKNLYLSADELISTLDDAKAIRAKAVVGNKKGQYPAESVAIFDAAIKEAEKIIANGESDEEFLQANTALITDMDRFKKSIIVILPTLLYDAAGSEITFAKVGGVNNYAIAFNGNPVVDGKIVMTAGAKAVNIVVDPAISCAVAGGGVSIVLLVSDVDVTNSGQFISLRGVDGSGQGGIKIKTGTTDGTLHTTWVDSEWTGALSSKFPIDRSLSTLSYTYQSDKFGGTGSAFYLNGTHIGAHKALKTSPPVGGIALGAINAISSLFMNTGMRIHRVQIYANQLSDSEVIVAEQAIKESYDNPTSSVENTVADSNIQIVVKDNQIRVYGTDLEPQVFTVSGIEVNGNTKLSSGVYVVKVGGLTTKIVIK